MESIRAGASRSGSWLVYSKNSRAKMITQFFLGARNAILVLLVFLTLLIFAHHSAGVPAESKFAEYCLSKSGEAFAAFLGLITGQHLLTGNGNGKKNPDPLKPADPSQAASAAIGAPIP